jgi:hypothetical protein
MKTHHILAVFVGLALYGPDLSIAQEAESQTDWVAEDNVAGVLGLPVMPGLRERTDETILFDKPEGRLLEAQLVPATAAPAMEADDIAAWYRQALLSNGWSAQPSDSEGVHLYVRRGESLHINIVKTDSQLTLNLSLAPSPQAD